MSLAHLRFASDILRRLGEELIPHVDQGIIELVRNAYDADAQCCEVELLGTEEPGGTLRVIDDGVGMTAEEIRSGWLVLGRSAKAQRAPSALGRLPVGDKGLGRLAALRMGAIAQLVTRPKSEPGAQYRLTLDWSEFIAADTVEQLPLEIAEEETDEAPGTEIEVNNLQVRISRREVQRLARSLLLLADPFASSLGFRPRLRAPTFADLERRVQDAYFEDAEYRLVARLDEQGRASAQVFDWGGQTLFSAEHRDLSETPYETSTAEFELWVFLLDTRKFTARSSTLADVRAWLEVVGGVHLYQRGLRVHPYGDPGHDWLEMNLARARSPEERPSTNNSIGRITVFDPEELLIQKTDRTGFIENEAFTELRRFGKDALEWMAKQRLRVAEEKRRAKRAEAPARVEDARRSLDQVLQSVPAPVRTSILAAVRRYDQEREREATTWREEAQLYRTLATVGTTAAVFAHESGQPVTRIEKAANEIQKAAQNTNTQLNRGDLLDLTRIIRNAAQSVKSFADLPIKLLQREKRRVERVAVHAILEDVLTLFDPFLAAAEVQVDRRFADDDVIMRASVSALEAIFTNLLTNAVNAFNRAGAALVKRRVMISSEISGDRLLVRFLDSGPGIVGISLDEIWLPGRTTKPGGTGLGLTIVKDTVTDLGGRVTARQNNEELGGAEFILELPVVGAAS
jgi:signal transduction histidine kinase